MNRRPKNTFQQPDLNALLQNLPCGVYWKDKNNVYLGCNEFMAKIAGFSTSAEVIGKTDIELCWRENASALKKMDEKVISTGKPVTAEETCLLADGNLATYLSTKLPLTDTEGNIIGIFGISVDITSHKRNAEILKAEKQKIEDADRAQFLMLVELNQKITGQILAENTTIEEHALHMLSYLENIIACMPGSVYWKDTNGIYRGGNDIAARLAGLTSRGEIVGRTDYDFSKSLGWSQEILEYVINVDNEVMQTGIPRLNYEERPFKGADGKYLYQLSSKVPLFDKFGEVVGLVGISIDITERKKMEKALLDAKEAAESANKAKTEFLENIRHDLRTPLTGIIGFTNLIKSEVDNPKIAGYVDNLQVSSYALLELINEVLESMRIASGEKPLLRKKFNLKTKLESVIKLNLAKAQEKCLSLVFHYDDTIPEYLIGDPRRIQRIVLNLVTNALNFTSQGKVEVSAKLAKINKKGRDVVIKIIVEDTGIGIPPDRMEEIFERFKRLTPSYEGTYKGLGLGLAIVKQFVDDLEGEIYLESKLQKGSIFTCIIPLRKALLDEPFDADQSSDEWPKLDFPLLKTENKWPVDKGKRASTGLTRILLVEDQSLAAKVAESLFISLNCVVDIAADGEAAVSFAKSNRYDLIFMDVGLPDISGNEATRRIRGWESLHNRHTPIVALTAHIDMDNKQQCIDAGMDAVLSKPLLKERAIEILNAFVPKSTQKAPEQRAKQINELFQLPADIIDLEGGAKLFDGNINSAKEMLKMLINNSLPQDAPELERVYKEQDWQAIQKIAHKILGGTCYCGTPRLKSACLNLEKYLKSGETELREPLYHQLLQEIAAVRNAAIH